MGWSSVATWACIVAGAALLVAFVRVELRVADPLIELRIFTHRGFAVDNVVLFLICACFVPLFFFASVYAQVVLSYTAAKTGLYILLIFAGFATASQIGGRIVDRRGARPAALAGSVLGAVGFWLWAGHLQKGLGSQWYWIVLAGAGIGLALTPVSTDAINRAPRGSYGEVTGVTQTVRYFASSLGLAVLGTILIDQTHADIVGSLTREGAPKSVADQVASAFNSGSASRPASASDLATIQHDFAQATRIVYLGMAVAMAASIVAAWFMERGVPDEVAAAASEQLSPETASA